MMQNNWQEHVYYEVESGFRRPLNIITSQIF